MKCKFFYHTVQKHESFFEFCSKYILRYWWPIQEREPCEVSLLYYKADCPSNFIWLFCVLSKVKSSTFYPHPFSFNNGHLYIRVVIFTLFLSPPLSLGSHRCQGKRKKRLFAFPSTASWPQIKWLGKKGKRKVKGDSGASWDGSSSLPHVSLQEWRCFGRCKKSTEFYASEMH